jgi:hypothetical protein
MAKVKDQVAQLGVGTIVAGLKAVQNGVSKRKYKRLLATAVAQLLATDPDVGPRKARRLARKVVGVKPAKKVLVNPDKVGLKEGLETAAVAAVSGAALKAVEKIGRKVSTKLKNGQASEEGEEQLATKL